MSDVLRWVENAESKSGKKIAGWQKASNRAKWETGAIFKEVGNVLELWDIVFTVAAVLNQEWEDVVVLSAGMSGVKLCQVSEDYSPGFRLFFGVFDVGQLVRRTNSD